MPAASRDANGTFLIDRSGKHFEPVLNYLRTGRLVIDDGVSLHGVLEEAQFFGIQSLVEKVIDRLKNAYKDSDTQPLSRREVGICGDGKANVIQVIGCLLQNPFHQSSDHQIRFQGVNLSGCDLSRLDLRNANLKFADLSNTDLSLANLSNAVLERANLSNAVLNGAQLVGVRMSCANLEGARLRQCIFENGSPEGYANLEGCNLRSADLDGSQMTHVNMRVACLKRARLVNCMLRSAVLAGADLQDCDMSGSDLQDANLRGANLLNTVFDDMKTAVHMCQLANK